MAVAPVVADVDGDHKSEIIFVGTQVESSIDEDIYHGGIYLFDEDGSIIFEYDEPDWRIPGGLGLDGIDMIAKFQMGATPAVADIDEDGEMEILVPTWQSGLIIFNIDGSIQNRIAFPGEIMLSSPAVADLDPSYPGLEFVIGSNDGRVYAYHYDGSSFGNWPYNFGRFIHSSPAIADLGGDGDLEVIISSYSSIRVLTNDGVSDSNFGSPMYNSMAASKPVVADLNNDGRQEIIVGMNSASPGYISLGGATHLSVLDLNGDFLDLTPLETVGDTMGPPAVADLDGDGDSEIIAGAYSTESGIYIWDPIYSFGDSDWPQYSHDMGHTGNYYYEDPSIICADDTPNGQCSNSQPQYCDSGELINNCQECGCPEFARKCSLAGHCYSKPYPIRYYFESIGIDFD